MANVRKLLESFSVADLGVVIAAFGLVIFPIHNAQQPFIEYIFLPSLATLMISLGAVIWAANSSWSREKIRVALGEKRVWVPMVAIVAGAVANAAVFHSREAIGGAVMLPLLFLLYAMARVERSRATRFFVLAVIIESLSVVVESLVLRVRVGGIITSLPASVPGTLEANYSIPVMFIGIGAFIAYPQLKKSWQRAGLLTVALLGMLFTGSPEAAWVGGVLVVALIVANWNGGRGRVEVMLPVLIALVVAVAMVLLSYGGEIYRYTAWSLEKAAGGASPNPDFGAGVTESPLDGRVRVAWENLKAFPPNTLQFWFGTGYNITSFGHTTHNVPLIIANQIGPIAALGWLWVTGLMLVRTVRTKSRWAFLWVAIAAASVGDHAVWTQLAPWWWVAAGVTTKAVEAEQNGRNNENEAIHGSGNTLSERVAAP